MTKIDLIQLKKFSYFSILISFCFYQTVVSQIIYQFSYKIDKNTNLTDDFKAENAIKIISLLKTPIACLAECNKLETCMSATYSNSTCFLFNTTLLMSNQTSTSQNINLYTKIINDSVPRGYSVTTTSSTTTSVTSTTTRTTTSTTTTRTTSTSTTTTYSCNPNTNTELWKACTTNAGCANGLVCNTYAGGFCVCSQYTSFYTVCSSSTDCGSYMSCSGGVCKLKWGQYCYYPLSFAAGGKIGFCTGLCRNSNLCS